MWEHDSFAEGLESDFVFLYLDYPSGEEAKARVPNPERNEELQAKYGIRGFPTVLLMTAEGEVFGTTGYQPDGPEKYVEHVKALTESGKKALKKVVELEKQYAEADAETKPLIVKQAIDMLTNLEDGAAGAAKLGDLVRKGFELDPENESGLKLSALECLFAKGQAGEAEFAVGMEMDADNAKGLYEKVVGARIMQVRDEETATAFVATLKTFLELGKIHDQPTVQNWCATVAGWCDGPLSNPEDAQFFAKKAQEMGELEGRAKATVERILEKAAA